eukprot:s115_g31.t1
MAKSALQEGRRHMKLGTCLHLLPLVCLSFWVFSASMGFCAQRSRPLARAAGVADAFVRARTKLRAEDMEEDLEEVDLDNDPNWPKVKKEMIRIWNIRHESDEWLVADDVKLIMDEHLQSVVGKQNYLDMEETFVEVADEEPRPGEISRESFSEIAGIYVFNALYL